MRLKDDIDFTTLSWVKRELDETLKQARQALQAYVEDPGDTSQMRFCATYLHQVHGTLRMVELHGAAMVVDEMERVATGLLENTIEDPEDAYEVLIRGMVQLPDYLERLQGGHKDIPVVLLPLLNELRSLRGENELSEMALFAPKLDAELPPSANGPARPIADVKLRAATVKLRKAFEASLLQWLKTDDGADAVLARMAAICDKLASVTAVEAGRRLWWVAAGVLHGARRGTVQASRPMKLLFGRVDQEIKRQALKGEEALAGGIADDLTRQLLFHAAHGGDDSPRITELKETFDLPSLLPDEEELRHAQGSLTGHNRALLDTVAAAIKEDLMRVKDGLDLKLRRSDTSSEGYEPLVENLDKVADTLGMLGLEQPRSSVLSERDQLSAFAEGREEVTEAALMDLASSMLYVEASLDDYIDQLGSVEKTPAADGEIKLSADLPSAEIRRILDALMKESSDNLQEIKRSIIEFIEAPWDHERMRETPRLLEEIVGGLRMLELHQAGDLLEGVICFVETELLRKRAVPTAEQLDTLADAVASIEYFLEAVREHRPGRNKILEVAHASLERLGYLGDEGKRRYQAAADQHDQGEPVAADGADDGALDVDSEGSFEDTREMPAVDLRAVDGGEPTPPAAPAKPAAPVQGDGEPDIADDIDEEIREVFIEEVEEELQTLASLYPKWRDDLEDQDTLTTIRRTFHTLKGSGRLVGAYTIGEFSWQIENLLNRVLDGTRAPTRGVLELMDATVAALPQLLANVKGEGRPTVDIEEIKRTAEQLATGAEVSIKGGGEEAAATAPTEEVEEAAAEDEFADLELEAPDTDDGAEPLSAEGAEEDLEAQRESGEMAEDLELTLDEDTSRDVTAALDDLQTHFDEHAETPDSVSLDSPLEQRSDEDTFAGEDAAAVDAWIASSTEDEETESADTGDYDLSGLIEEDSPAEEQHAAPDGAEEPEPSFELDLDDFDDAELAEPSVDPELEAPTEAPGDAHAGSDESMDAGSEAPEPVAPAETAASSQDQFAIDPVLLDILRSEVAGHVVAIREYLEQAQGSDPTPPASEPLLRAVHTLNGAVAMVDVGPLTLVTGPLERYIKRLRLLDRGPSAEGMVAIADSVTVVEAVVEALGHEGAQYPEVTPLSERLKTLSDVLPEPADISTLFPVDDEADSEDEAAAPVEDPAAFDPMESEQSGGDGPQVQDEQIDAGAGEEIEVEGLDLSDEDSAMAEDPGDLPELTEEDFFAETAEADSASVDEEDDWFKLDETAEEAAPADPGDQQQPESPETAAFDAGESDASESEAAELEAMEFDTGEPEATPPEAVEFEPVDAPASDSPLDEPQSSDPEAMETERFGPEASQPEPEAGEAPEAEFADYEFTDTELSETQTQEPESIESEPVEPERIEPEVIELESGESELLPPEAAESEAAESETAESEAAESEAAESEAAESEAAESEAAESEAAESEAAESETAEARFAASELGFDPDAAEEDLTAGSAVELDDAWGGDETTPEAPVDEIDLDEAAQEVAETQAEESAETVPAEPYVSLVPDQEPDSVPMEALGDLDEELLDIFLEEGAEILDAADHKMVEFREDPTSTTTVTELQRSLHTLKGGARMAGIAPIGDLSHAMESLFEAAVDGQIQISTPIIELLEHSFDRLHKMLAQVGRRQALPSGDELVARMDAVLAGESLDEVLSADAPEAKLESDQPQATPVRRPAVERRTALDQEEERKGVSARPQQELIRVRANLLDNLVNYAGEVSIYRARLEQQVGSFRFNLVEFDQTVARLRDQLRKLEIETEAQILSRFQREHAEAELDFDPLELDRFSQLQQYSRALAESVADLVSIQNLLDDITRESETLLLQQSRVNSDLQEGLMRTRMVPFDSLVPRLRRILRQTTQELGKRAQLRVEGAHGEMDRTVLERITAPLEHMLRNAVAHGLESPDARSQAGKPEDGTIRIRVSREATEVVLRVSDDGAGIDHEKVRQKAVERGLLKTDATLSERDLFGFILESGFSTADDVSKIAGRGVGMDVVASEIKQLGGTLDISSKRGEGTTFTIRLPFTLAVTHAIMVRIGDVTFAIPLSSIQGVVRMKRHEFERRMEAGETAYDYNGEIYQLQELNTLLGLEKTEHIEGDMLPVLMSRVGDQRAAIRIDAVMSSREIVVKSVGPQISSIPGIFGATILGDGSVIMILDLGPLIRRGAALQLADLEEEERVEAPEAEIPLQDRAPLIMVVDDSITMRKVTSRVLQRHDMEVFTAKDGVDALEQLQERIPDLMLLDIEMPRMDGYELATHMRNDDRLKHVPIIMITSRTGEKHRQRALEIGVNRYLGKPYQEADLLENVRELLDETVGAHG